MQENSNSDNKTILADYDPWHRNRRDGGETDSPLSHPWYDSVYREIQSHPGGRMLEVGCGRGGFAIWLSRVAPRFKVTGLDFSQSAVEIARESAASHQAGVDV